MSKPAADEGRVPATAVESVAHATPSPSTSPALAQPSTRATTEQPAAAERLAKGSDAADDPPFPAGALIDLAPDRAPEVTPMVLRSGRRENPAVSTTPPGTPPPGVGPVLEGPVAPPMLAGTVTTTIVPAGPVTDGLASVAKRDPTPIPNPATAAIYERVLGQHLSVAIEAAITRVLPAALEAARIAAHQSPVERSSVEIPSPEAPADVTPAVTTGPTRAKVIDPSSGLI